MIAFGPVPSRRLGRSMGVSNVPPKICTCHIFRDHRFCMRKLWREG